MNMYNNFMGQGMVPNQYQQPKTLNWLPAEDYALLQKGLSQFKLSITKEELVVALVLFVELISILRIILLKRLRWQ